MHGPDSTSPPLTGDYACLCSCASAGACSLLPSLSPECRARLVEATKQIAAAGLPQSRIDSLIPRHFDASSSAGEDSTQPPTVEARPPSEAASEAAGRSPILLFVFCFFVVSLFVCLLVCMFVCLFAYCLFIRCLFVSCLLFVVCLFVVCLLVCLFACLFVGSLIVCLSVVRLFVVVCCLFCCLFARCVGCCPNLTDCFQCLSSVCLVRCDMSA